MDNDFLLEQEQALERMREMSARATKSVEGMPPVPPFVRVPGEGNRTRQQNGQPHMPGPSSSSHRQNPRHAAAERAEKRPPAQQNHNNMGGMPGGLNLPFLDAFKTEPDLSLIVGLMLLLLSENADKKLLLALVYILM